MIAPHTSICRPAHFLILFLEVSLHYFNLAHLLLTLLTLRRRNIYTDFSALFDFKAFTTSDNGLRGEAPCFQVLQCLLLCLQLSSNFLVCSLFVNFQRSVRLPWYEKPLVLRRYV